MSQRRRKLNKPTQIKQDTRLPRIDTARGLAVVAMIAYHFCYDLVYFQWVYFDFQYDSFWLAARFLIVSFFLLLVGVGLQLATKNKTNLNSKHYKRLWVIIICAALVSLGSFFLFGQRFIFFGILHLIGVASLIALWLRHTLIGSTVLATLCVLLGFGFEHPWFNMPMMQWLGMMTFAPATEDYVPLLPWLGLVLYGSVLGAYLLSSPIWLARLAKTANSRLEMALQFLGRRALWVYLLHQPILMAFLYGVKIFALSV